jgi:CDP-diacylglycerol--glycerol-3-phosphate 3-phosphatidyltransferase
MANFLTLSRIALIIPFAAMFFTAAAWAPVAALCIFVLAAATDFLDGIIARARGETSPLGAALDPLADKLLVAAALLLLVRNGTIREADVVASLAILLREILIGGLREAVSARGQDLAVIPLAKWKTAAQLSAIALFLAAAPSSLVGAALLPWASVALWIAAFLTVVTGAAYARRAVDLLRAPAG